MPEHDCERLIQEMIAASAEPVSDACFVDAFAEALVREGVTFDPPVDRPSRARIALASVWEHEERLDLPDSTVRLVMAFVGLEPSTYYWPPFTDAMRYRECRGCQTLVMRGHRGSCPDGHCTDCCTCFRCESCDRRYSDQGGCERCEGCESCCECAHCEHCGEAVESTCSHCNQCDDHCDCLICPRCDERVDHRCEECERCSDCCVCEDGIALQERDEGSPWHARAPADRQHFHSSRLCGVEWEINSAGSSQPLKDWANNWRGGIHHDGSCGWEMVTAPVAGDHVEACLSDLGTALIEAEAKADERCGLHVHVSVSDYWWPDILRLLRVFAHVEPVLFVLGGQNRMSNDYCRRSGDIFRRVLGHMDRKSAVLSLFERHPSMSNGRNMAKSYKGRFSKKSDGRYKSLNIVPWLARHRQGNKQRVPDTTVEFRLHRNTLDPKRVIGWAKLCVTLVDWIARATDAEADAVCGLSALRALSIIAPDSTPWILDRVRAWRKATSRRKRLVRIQKGAWTCVG